MRSARPRFVAANTRTIAIAAALLLGLCLCSRVNAAFVVTITQSGSDVVANGSGTINTVALTFGSNNTTNSGMAPSSGVIAVGPSSFVSITDYTSAGVTGPTNFGTGGAALASFGSGNMVGMSGGPVVPSGYTSGSALSDSATWSGKTLSGLGLTTGTYTWSWGTGPTADSFTVDVTPEPASSGLLALASSYALLARRRRNA